jgi:nucleotide-binding universal stress UspA family protein
MQVQPGRHEDSFMFKHILVPVDLADTDLAKSAIETAVSLARVSEDWSACSMSCRPPR